MFPYTCADFLAAYKICGLKPIRGRTYKYGQNNSLVGCCPIGALVIVKGKVRHMDNVYSKAFDLVDIGLTTSQRNGFIQGFDAQPFPPNTPISASTLEAYAVGTEVYQVLKEKGML